MTGLGLKEDEEQQKTDAWPDEQPRQEPDFVPIAYLPPTEEESVRRSSLAYSAGITFFCSVVFMLFLGWGADLLFGSSPWGLVGGIVLGSVIGFIQFFRITSQIFNSKKAESEMRPLMSHDDDDKAEGENTPRF
jgi:F0F1-type ATP synthase assembly protein I